MTKNVECESPMALAAASRRLKNIVFLACRLQNAIERGDFSDSRLRIMRAMADGIEANAFELALAAHEWNKPGRLDELLGSGEAAL